MSGDVNQDNNPSYQGADRDGEWQQLPQQSHQPPVFETRPVQPFRLRHLTDSVALGTSLRDRIGGRTHSHRTTRHTRNGPPARGLWFPVKARSSVHGVASARLAKVVRDPPRFSGSSLGRGGAGRRGRDDRSQPGPAGHQRDLFDDRHLIDVMPGLTEAGGGQPHLLVVVE